VWRIGLAFREIFCSLIILGDFNGKSHLVAWEEIGIAPFDFENSNFEQILLSLVFVSVTLLEVE
jgi:hypothetical protein